MDLLLALRSEMACMIILVFLYFTSRMYNLNSTSRAFIRILNLALIHVTFDIITVMTVNNMDTVPSWMNWVCHVIFYLSAILFSNEIVNYVVAICYPRKAKKLYIAGHALTAVYIMCLSFLKIDYVKYGGTYSSAGPAAVVGYGMGFLFFVIALVLIFTHMDTMSISIKRALIPMMLVLIVTEVCQMIWKDLLFTGGAVTIVTVGFFFSLENPVEVFKKKAMVDALTGVRSRSSYEEEIDKLDEKFKSRPGGEYTFVFCDLNDLRSVNNRLGHAEGDNYITLIAASINKCMLHASAIYRIGGDEFLIYYYKVGEEVVEKEIKDLQEACTKASEGMAYTAAISAGYARSSASYKTLRDVVKTADYAMYRNKERMKSSNSYVKNSLGTKLNYAGLTDKIFDAICASNDKSYPFITNMNTNVTRIASGWKEYFGLEEEFYADFNSVWRERIHPDYREGFMESIMEVMNGQQKYHNYDYFARRADGEYVRVTCHGSIYRDSGSGNTFFTGFIVNHGMEDNTDAVTGLYNFDILTANVCRHINEHRPFSVLKLKLNNFARVNMLYGYSGGNRVIKKIAETLEKELGDRGQVFCQSSANFTILLETNDDAEIDSYYRRISEICANGLETEGGNVPVLISGGAFISNGEKHEIEKIRAGLVFALEESHYYQRHNLVFYNELEDAVAGSDVSMLSKIHSDALTGMQYFQMRYQPIVDIASGKTVGAEALLRWMHPVYGDVSPGKFIAFLENDPCYYRLGLGILERAIEDAKKIQRLIPDFHINVNITALQLLNENFAKNVFEILEKYDYAPHDLVLELTERCKEMDSGFLAKKIAELRKRGILIAFDDLGTGYSTISLLMDIPVDEIKLDKDFVRDIRNRENYQLFVRALVLGSSSHGNNYNICFEGIEDEDMLSLVSLFGNFLAQGYYFAKPLLFDDFKEYIRKEIEK